MRFDLGPMVDLLRSLGDPHRVTPIVLIGGTNGKGTVAALLAGILAAAGYRCGLYTSPHLEEVRERIRIDGESVSDQELEDALREILRSTTLRPTHFEALTAAAHLIFSRSSLDLAVLEVGLGGRLDATNVSDPLLSIVTSVSPDHVRILGSTLGEIAGEKAGIFRTGVPALADGTDPEVRRALRRKAADRGVPLELVELPDAPEPAREESGNPTGERREMRQLLGGPGSDLSDRFHPMNLALAIRSAEVLAEIGWSRVDASAVAIGLTSTRWPGRLESVRISDVDLLLDCAHNRDAARRLAGWIRGRQPAPLGLLFGTVSDKAVSDMLRPLLPLTDRLYLTRPLGTPRALPPGAVRETVSSLDFDGVVAEGELPEILDRALVRESSLVVAGSLRLVGPVRVLLRSRFGRPEPAADRLFDREIPAREGPSRATP
ncbi:MAG: Mur ligase family protein [Thermoanaerobaculia bacterium]|nr:Mur ligase family protein [Thermoanaerobaculia bacterium]